MSDDQADAPGHVGRPERRREDARFLTGRSRFTADIAAPDALHMAVLRSPHAHARLGRIGAAKALALPGMVRVFTGADLAGEVDDLTCEWVIPTMTVEPRQPVLARDRVRFAGEPVAAVLAENAYAAMAALDAIDVAYEPLPAATGAEAALADGAPALHEDVPGNRAFVFRRGEDRFEEAAAGAAVRLEQRLINTRLMPAPLETRSILSDYDPATGRLTHTTSTQLPHVHKRALARALGFPQHKLRLVAPDVGGGFGAKLQFYPEDVLCAYLAIRERRPVRWTESRSESVTATTHGRDHVQDIALAAEADGTITALRVRILANLGAWPAAMGPGVPAINCAAQVSGAYRIPAVGCEVVGVYTNTASVGPYRGAGHPEATYLIERMVDLLAGRLDLDPAEVRRKNFVPKDAFPYKLPTGLTYDSGDYHANLDKALERIGYADLRRRQAELRAQGRYLGIGMATYVEFSGAAPSMAMGAIGFRRGGFESAHVRIHPDGRATVFCGASAHGQGHETSLAQIAADALGIPAADIEVVESDTDRVPFGTGTFNSRSMAVGGSAVHTACGRVMEKATRIAAHLMQLRPADAVYEDGVFRRPESPGAVARAAHLAKRAGEQVYGAVFKRVANLEVSPTAGREAAEAVSFAEVAAMAHLGHHLPIGEEPGLEAIAAFDPKGLSASFGTHVAVVEVDPETGRTRIERYLAVEDCGTVINPLLADGQVHGGAAQGIGQALIEVLRYDAAGQAHTADPIGMAVPHAAHVPAIETDRTVTPSPLTPLGAKGVGEGATIGAPPAVVNAVTDALAPLGVRHIDMPLHPETVWRAIRDRPSA
jgi:carbon-monoxide dehydrogenase large subunit